MHVRIQGLVTSANDLAQKWSLIVERWDTAGLPDDKPNARLHGATFKEFGKRVMATLDLVASLGRVDEAGQLLFLPKVDSAAKQLKVAHSSVDQLSSELNAQPLALFRDPNGNLDGLQGFVNGAHVSNANAGTQLDQIGNSMTALFDSVSTGLKFGKAKGLSLYHTYGEQLQDLTTGARQLHAEIKALEEAVIVLHSEAKASAEQAQEFSTTAEEALGSIKESFADVKASQAEIDAKLATVRETTKAAASLEAQVEGYEASFDAFQKSLDERVAQHAAFEKNMAEALVTNKNRESEIDRLIAKADSMIKGATTAGLGDSLENTRKLYQKRMVGAGIGFFLSILLLAASAIPLVAHILPGLFIAWIPPAVHAGVTSQTENGAVLLSLLGKVFLMFPATWLTQFFSKAYSEFFHLEREYAHKAALARSVEGFKKQAPKYEEEIATAVFFEVQSNPSKQKSPEAAEHPILGPLMKKFIDALPLGKTADSKPPKHLKPQDV